MTDKKADIGCQSTEGVVVTATSRRSRRPTKRGLPPANEWFRVPLQAEAWVPVTRVRAWTLGRGGVVVLSVIR